MHDGETHETVAKCTKTAGDGEGECANSNENAGRDDEAQAESCVKKTRKMFQVCANGEPQQEKLKKGDRVALESRLICLPEGKVGSDR